MVIAQYCAAKWGVLIIGPTMSTPKQKRGRKPVAGAVASVSISIDAAHLAAADTLASDMGQVFAGLTQSRRRAPDGYRTRALEHAGRG